MNCEIVTHNGLLRIEVKTPVVSISLDGRNTMKLTVDEAKSMRNALAAALK